MEIPIVQALLSVYNQTLAPIVVPSYRNRRGHPWIVARSLWSDIMVVEPPKSFRDILTANADLIHYLEVDNDAILKDLDTPMDYSRERPISL